MTFRGFVKTNRIITKMKGEKEKGEKNKEKETSFLSRNMISLKDKGDKNEIKTKAIERKETMKIEKVLMYGPELLVFSFLHMHVGRDEKSRYILETKLLSDLGIPRQNGDGRFAKNYVCFVVNDTDMVRVIDKPQ